MQNTIIQNNKKHEEALALSEANKSKITVLPYGLKRLAWGEGKKESMFNKVEKR